MQLPVLNLPLSAIGQLDLHVQLSLTHHQVQIHTSFHRFKEIGDQVKKNTVYMFYKYKKNTFQVAIEIWPISCQNDLEPQEGTKE